MAAGGRGMAGTRMGRGPWTAAQGPHRVQGEDQGCGGLCAVERAGCLHVLQGRAAGGGRRCEPASAELSPLHADLHCNKNV